MELTTKPAPTPDAKPMQPTGGAERPRLTPQGVNLKALLAAYDETQASMTPEDRQAMNQRVVSGEEQFTISAEEAEKKRAAVRIAELEGKTVEEGEKDRQTLEEAAKTLNAPGIENLLRILGSDETKKKP